MRLLLFSNSTQFFGGFTPNDAEKEIGDFFGDSVKKVLYILYAQHNERKYADIASETFKPLSIAVDPIYDHEDKKQAIENAEALYIGGGNTFRLLSKLYEYDLVETIQERVRAGMPYMGSSASSVLAGPTMKTTNDMPILEPKSFDAFGFLPFQINPHYTNEIPEGWHGETRDVRIEEFLEENGTPVLGLPENSWIRLEEDKLTYKGTTTAPAKLFKRSKLPEEFPIGSDLSHLLTT